MVCLPLAMLMTTQVRRSLRCGRCVVCRTLLRDSSPCPKLLVRVSVVRECSLFTASVLMFIVWGVNVTCVSYVSYSTVGVVTIND